MTDTGRQPQSSVRPKRIDARRNEQTLLDAAAAVFVSSGVDAPVREIAAKAGVGMGTIYRHFPTRADLIVAVYRHQVEACAEAGPALLADAASPHAALAQWMGLFADFLVTKHGLATALHGDQAGFDTLHTYFVDRLVPVCTSLLDAAAVAGEITTDIGAYELMRGIGNLCIFADRDPRYNARRLVDLLIAGLRAPSPDGHRAAISREVRRSRARARGLTELADDRQASGDEAGSMADGNEHTAYRRTSSVREIRHHAPYVGLLLAQEGGRGTRTDGSLHGEQRWQQL